jgi:hypothetical protein
MSEVEDRVLALERWCVELDEELRRLKTVLSAVGTVALQAGNREEP